MPGDHDAEIRRTPGRDDLLQRSEEQWFAAGADENGEVYGDRDFRPIADCATFDEAKQAALHAGDNVRGRIFIHEMVMGEKGRLFL